MIMCQDFLKWESSAVCVDFKPAYVDMAGGNVLAGLLLSQIVFWHLPTSQAQFVMHNGKAWLAKSHRDWYRECRLSRQNVRTALKCLSKHGLIDYCTLKNQGLVHLNEDRFLSRWQELVDSTTPPTSEAANLTSRAANLTNIKERKKEENRSVYVCDDDLSSVETSAIFEQLSEINATLAKPIGGLPQLAHELQTKGHTSSVVADIWRECQAANKPVGAFLFWAKHDYLPFKPKQKPAPTKRAKQTSQPDDWASIFKALTALNNQLPSDAKPLIGLPAMVDKLTKRQESVKTMRDAWNSCKFANNPIGAFVRWVNDGTLPLINQQSVPDEEGRVWGGAGVGWIELRNQKAKNQK